MTMTCKTCGGVCEWREDVTEVTKRLSAVRRYTECRGCGAVDNQLPAEPELPDSEGGNPD